MPDRPEEARKMHKLAHRLAEETPAIPVEWDEEAQRKYREWWDSLSPEEQDKWRDGMIAT